MKILKKERESFGGPPLLAAGEQDKRRKVDKKKGCQDVLTYSPLLLLFDALLSICECDIECD